MDYEMPVMDGPTASKEIRALGCDSLIVGVTGNALPEDTAHLRSCGANAVLIKPFQMEALEEILVEFGVTLQRSISTVLSV
jgi:CheY-like chemotaxis protein